ncbi:hypothetical protein [Actinoplanes sp. NPDC026670]|uniref:hypothetical protein n=1 Tax=Actinoplanes sp. NPDC026670 TaxID=3154700 RepID=UPI0033C0C90A
MTKLHQHREIIAKGVGTGAGFAAMLCGSPDGGILIGFAVEAVVLKVWREQARDEPGPQTPAEHRK